MTFRRFQPLLLLVLCAALYGGSQIAMKIAPMHPALETRIEGGFTEGDGGWHPGESFVTAQPVRAWGSWSGSDENTGTLAIGPFLAPSRLRFAIGGYPGKTDITVVAERVEDGARVPLKLFDVGERWRITDHELPHDWYRRPIKLIAVDEAKGIGGWIGITEPIRGGRGAGPAALLETFAAWAINGVLLGILWLAAVRLLRRSGRVTETWIPLAAVGGVACVGYLVFWAYFAHATLGPVVSWASLGAGGLVLAWTRRNAAAESDPARALANPGRSDTARIVRLTVTIGALYLAVLHIFPASLDFYSLAANRFRPALPSDNQLPHEAAERLVAGVPLRQLNSDWLSSDRPPLQCGWELITWPVGAKLGIDSRAMSGTAAVWFQLAWVASAFALFRALGLSSRRTAGWVAAIALAGFFLQNTTFTWPKLSAAAFACAAFALWSQPRAGSQRRDDILVGAVFAALAWLSHGGVAFSFLALAPWLVWRFVRGEWRLWLMGAAVFATFALPWIAYQKFYDPPGNRLLKWHLAGQIPKDERGTLETIRDSYRALSWAEIWDHKRRNLETQIRGNWSGLLTLSAETAVNRRNEEFFLPTRALTWWPLALLLLPFAWRRHTQGERNWANRRLHLGLLIWTLATTVLWCFLMFLGDNAVIHQGSYAIMLAAFVLLSAWFEAAGRRWLIIVVLLQTVTLLTTWVPPNEIVRGEPNFDAIAIALGAAVALAWHWLRAYQDFNDDAEGAKPRVVVDAESEAMTPGSPVPESIPGLWAASFRDRRLAWWVGLVALLPLVWCLPKFSQLWWFGDDWDLLDQIAREGFWRWTFQPFAENVVPVFKLLWGGLVYAGGGSYLPMIVALWLTHALNTVLFARLLHGAGWGRTAVIFASGIFALSAANVETLAWSVQWSALLAVSFFLFAANWLQPRLSQVSVASAGSLAVLGVLSALSALTFARGVLTGAALAGVVLFGAVSQSMSWRVRLRVIAACLLPALTVVVAILVVSPGNHQAMGGHGREMAAFAFSYWAAAPLQRLLELGVWAVQPVIALGVMKLGLVVWAFRRVGGKRRDLLLLFLLLDLGNAVLLGIGRHHTGLPASNSERYQYAALLCTLPFLALAFEAWLAVVPVPKVRRLVAVAVVLLVTWRAARPWPHLMEQFAAGRGEATRQVLLRESQPPPEGAVPGIPFLRTERAKELIVLYRLH